MPSKHPRIAVTADPELGEALARVRAATGTREPDATLLRRLAVDGAEAELEAGRNRRVAAEALFEAMDSPAVRPRPRSGRSPQRAACGLMAVRIWDGSGTVLADTSAWMRSRKDPRARDLLLAAVGAVMSAGAGPCATS